MKSLLLRFWHWLGRLLGQEAAGHEPQRTIDDRPTAGDVAEVPDASMSPGAPPPPVMLPSPLPPQLPLHTGEAARFSRKASILTKPESRLYRSLLFAVRTDYQVMAKVRLWDFIWLENEPPERKEHLGRLSCRHVDFLLCTPETLKPLLVIELDDKSHQSPYAQESDRYKNELFAAAGLPLLRLDHSDVAPRRLRALIDAQIAGSV